MSARLLTLADHAGFVALMQELHPAGSIATARPAFETILSQPGTTLWGVSRDATLAATATLHLLPNLTYGGRPYGLIENVVTHPDFRNLGLARAVLNAIVAHATQAKAYKLMLLTGKQRGAAAFYARMGFDGDEKTGMILRLP